MQSSGDYRFDPTQLNDKELNDYIQGYRNQLTRTLSSQDKSPSVLALQSGWQNDLNRLEQELTKRQGQQESQSEYDRISGLYNNIGGVTPSFDQTGYVNDLNQSAQNQRQAVGDIYSNELAGGLQGINQSFIPQKQGLVEDLAAQGLLNQANSRYALNDLEGRKGQAIAGLYSGLGAERGRSLSGLEQGLASGIQGGRQFAANLAQNNNQFNQNLGLSRANALSDALTGSNRFNKQFGLAQNQFNSGQGENNFQNMQGLYGLNEASRLGNMQAQNQKPGTLDYLNAFSNLAGGVGGLAGGLGGFKRRRGEV